MDGGSDRDCDPTMSARAPAGARHSWLERGHDDDEHDHQWPCQRGNGTPIRRDASLADRRAAAAVRADGAHSPLRTGGAGRAQERARCPASSTSTSARKRPPSASVPICAPTIGSPARIAATATPWPRAFRPNQVMAELYAKVGGCCGGRGGSMHLYAKKYGLFGTNGFVGGGIPGCGRPGAQLAHARHRPGDGLLLRRRSGQPRRVPRIDQFRRRAESAGRSSFAKTTCTPPPRR